MSCEDPKPSEHEADMPPLPDPDGRPQPVNNGDPLRTVLTTAGAAGVVLGGLLLVGVATSRPTAGSTRSTQLQWKDRQDQIEQAFQDDAAYRTSENETSP